MSPPISTLIISLLRRLEGLPRQSRPCPHHATPHPHRPPPQNIPASALLPNRLHPFPSLQEKSSAPLKPTPLWSFPPPTTYKPPPPAPPARTRRPSRRDPRLTPSLSPDPKPAVLPFPGPYPLSSLRGAGKRPGTRCKRGRGTDSGTPWSPPTTQKRFRLRAMQSLTGVRGFS